jgi:DNA-directed RNA polymerase subunit M/transcription elongation factor TFIIS
MSVMNSAKASTVIVARCVSCRHERNIDEAESERLTREHSVPICDKCGSVMVADRVEERLR